MAPHGLGDQARPQRQHLEKVFLSDPSGKNADLVRQAVGDKLGGVYSSPAELLEEHKIQMAVVTMALSRMPDAVLAALEAGAHVLVEKPGATGPDAYAPLVELAKAPGGCSSPWR